MNPSGGLGYGALSGKMERTASQACNEFMVKHSSFKLQALRSGFGWSLVGLFGMSLGLRIWGLHRFNTLVFDEIYYVNFARGFLQGVQEFGGHPPLSTYLIAAGIWLANQTPWGQQGEMNGLAGIMLTPWSYRWLNAFTGAWIPVVIAAIAYQLSHRRSYALVAGSFAALDGLFLVESRYALNNVCLVLFGLLGHLFFLLALNQRSATGWQRWCLVVLAGIGFGLSVAVKWNGLWFLLGAYGMWVAGWAIAWLNRLQPGLSTQATRRPADHPHHHPMERLTSLRPIQFLVGFALVPSLTYFLCWIPYMRLDSTTSLWQWQAKILDYHQRVGGMDAHPYCSAWYSWFVMARPVAYLYKTAHGLTDPPTLVGPLLPDEAANRVYDVHAIGNPFLWWFSTAAIALLIVGLGDRIWSWALPPQPSQPTPSSERISAPPVFNSTAWTALYLIINWVANWSPWVRVDRCIFIYHYMGASVFSLLGIALLVDRWLRSSTQWHRLVSITVIAMIGVAFWFWAPIYLGLPLSPAGFKARLWFSSWI